MQSNSLLAENSLKTVTRYIKRGIVTSWPLVITVIVLRIRTIQVNTSHTENVVCQGDIHFVNYSTGVHTSSDLRQNIQTQYDAAGNLWALSFPLLMHVHYIKETRVLMMVPVECWLHNDVSWYSGVDRCLSLLPLGNLRLFRLWQIALSLSVLVFVQVLSTSQLDLIKAALHKSELIFSMGLNVCCIKCAYD